MKDRLRDGVSIQKQERDGRNGVGLFVTEVQAPSASAILHDVAVVADVRKILAPIKIKSALPPPPPKTQNTPPPKTWNFMDRGFSCRKNAFFQVPIKLAQPFPAPELRTKVLRTRGFFSKEAKIPQPLL